jgi:hypothetical protein
MDTKSIETSSGEEEVSSSVQDDRIAEVVSEALEIERRSFRSST